MPHREDVTHVTLTGPRSTETYDLSARGGSVKEHNVKAPINRPGTPQGRYLEIIIPLEDKS